ncbi:hypothetical protein AB3459_01975 [Pseudomonas aeruginosa]
MCQLERGASHTRCATCDASLRARGGL